VQRITTATRSINKFGVGKDGFVGSVPGPPTQLEAVWYDNVQEELAAAVEDQGYALDGMTLNQLSFALNNYGYSGAVGFTNGSSLQFLTGATFVMDAGSTFQIDTSLAEFNGDLVIGDSSADALIVVSTSTFQSPVFFNGNVDIGNNIADTCTITATIDAAVNIAATDNAAYLVNATNLGTGGGIKSLTVGGYAGYFQTDTTSPVNAAVFIMPQDADPSSPTAGDLYHHSTRGKLRIRNFSQWESVHSSSKGSVFEATASADQIGLAGTTGNIAGTVIAPEVVGNVLVTGSFYWLPSEDTTTVSFIIRDNTAGVNITTEVIRAKDIDTVGAGARGETVVLRRVYTLPSTASRTFVLNITVVGGGASGADIRDIVLSVQGVL